MKELQEILRTWEVLCQQGRVAALATVVRVDGSAYRRPGARMLVAPDGETTGSVSGGCLEADVIVRASQVMETGEKVVVIYDTTDESDILFGVGLGCQGIVRVLIERLSPGNDVALALPTALLDNRGTGVLATVYAVEGPAPVAVGDRSLKTAEGSVHGEPLLDAEALRVLDTARSASRTVTMSGGRVEAFFEFLQPPLPLVIFGAGHDAPPVARLAKELGWHVTIADSRPAFATTARFPMADAVLVSRRGSLPDTLRLDGRTAAILMTHSYEIDHALLAELLPSPVGYLGVLGPKRRTERLLAELREEGRTVTDAMLARLHSPIGLDIGAETPEQIALAIVAEIQARTTDRPSGFLRDRRGPIYDSTDAEASQDPANGDQTACPRSA